MPIYSIIKLYWKPLLFLLIAIVTFIVINFYGVNKYNEGVSDATATMQDKLNKALADKDAQAKQASKNYQELKTAREKEQGIKYVEIEKIVDRPVYTSDCIDADGLSQINSAISRK